MAEAVCSAATRTFGRLRLASNTADRDDDEGGIVLVDCGFQIGDLVPGDVRASQDGQAQKIHAKSESISWKRANRTSAASVAMSRSWTSIGRFSQAGRGVPGNFGRLSLTPA